MQVSRPARKGKAEADERGERGEQHEHGRRTSRVSAPTSAATDFTAHLTVDGLKADTRYCDRVWFSGHGDDGDSHVSDSQIGTFRTAPAPSRHRPVSFVFGADVDGQGYCRNAAQGGYRIFGKMEALEPDFFIANGDLIYADYACPLINLI
jgi:alkaline phosphatase D